MKSKYIVKICLKRKKCNDSMLNEPATYELADNLNLRDIILKAGGLRGKINLIE